MPCPAISPRLVTRCLATFCLAGGLALSGCKSTGSSSGGHSQWGQGASFVTISPDQQASADRMLTLMDRADRAEASGNLDAAEKYLSAALKLQETLSGPLHPLYTENLFELGRLNFKLSRFEQATKIFDHVIKLNRSTLEPDDTAIPRTHFASGMAWLGQENPRRAQSRFEAGLHVQKRAGAEQNSDTALLHLGLGKAFIRQQKDQEAAEHLALARDLALAFNPPLTKVARNASQLLRGSPSDSGDDSLLSLLPARK